MNQITLLGNKIIFHSDEGKKNLPLSETVQFLWSVVEVHQSATVRTLLEILSSDSEFFQKALSEPFLVELIDHYKDPLFLKKESHLTTIGFTWWGEQWKYKKGETSFHLGLDVFGKNEEHDNWGIEFSSLASIIDLPIFIDNNVSISCFDMTKSKKEKKERKDPYDEKFEFGPQEITLIELLKAFVSEVTFCGSEEEKVERWSDLKERSDEVRKAIENGDTSKFTSFEELKEKLGLDKKEKNDEIDEDSFRKMMGEDED